MKKYLSVVLMLLLLGSAFGQTVTQTYTDRCTGEVHIFQINSQGSTTIVFYNRAKSFISNDIVTGVFKNWLEETYILWRNLNPCSANQAMVTTAVQTTQQIITNSLPSIPTPPPPTPPSTPAPTSTTSSQTSTSTKSNTSSETSSEGGTSSGSEESGEVSEKNEQGSEESSEEESSQSEESSEEEESEEDSKKSTQPPIVVANLAAIQSLDGSYMPAATFGITKSSLLGDESFGVSTMVWFDLSQILVNGNYNKNTTAFNGRVGLSHTTGVTFIKSYSTYTRVVTHGKVAVLKNGLVLGTAITGTRTSLEVPEGLRGLLNTVSLLTFATRSFIWSRVNLAPMLASSTQLFYYSRHDSVLELPMTTLYVTALNVNYNLTKRFTANLGANTAFDLKGTIPFMLNFTVGSRVIF
jgi:hypothetical protein